jgi:uncharacterized protein
MTALLVGVVMVVGVVGTIIPFVPGLVIVWAAGLVYGLIEGFGTTGWVAFAVMTVLLVLGSAATYVLPHRAGVLAGVGRTSLRLGMLGAVIGFVVIPVIGLPLGAVAGVWVGERRRLGGWQEAWGTTRTVVIGFGLGALVEFGSAVLMVVTWLIWLVTG